MPVQPPSRTKFYKDRRNGKLLGVCAGLADYTGMDVNLIRILLVLAIVMGGGAMIPVYFLAAWIAEDKPSELTYTDAEDRRFWQKVRQSPSRTARDIRASLRSIDRRVSDIETYVLNSNRSLEREIEQLR